MKKQIFLFTILLTIILSVPAYSVDRSDLIRQYLEYSGVVKGMKGIIDIQAQISLKNLGQKYNLSEEFKKDFKDVWIDVIINDFWAPGGIFDTLNPIFNDFTESELIELLEFYKSPVGKKFSKLAQNMQEYLQPLIPKMEQRISNKLLPEMLKRLEKRGWDRNGNRIQLNGD